MILHLLAFLSTIHAFAATRDAPVWFDTDIAIGRTLHDVDDAYALSIAFHSSNYSVIGISTVFGNLKNVRQITRIARAMVKDYAPYPVAVSQGAARAADLGEETAGSRALAAALRSGHLRIAATGPLTNIATVVLRNPELAKHIDEVLLMGGRRLESTAPVGPLHLKLPDANVDHDFPAIRVLLDSQVALTLMPTEISRQILFGKKDLERLSRGDASARWLGRTSVGWLRFWNLVVKTSGFIPFDALITSYLDSPGSFRCDDSIPVGIERLRNTTYHQPLRRQKDFLVVSHSLLTSRRARYCHDLADDYKNTLLHQLGAF